MTTHSRSSPPSTPQGRPSKLLSPALTVAALMSWLPSVVLVWVRLTWSTAPKRVPTHWSGPGVVDGWGSTTSAFWSLLVPGLVGALICSALSVALATDTSKAKAASAIGITSAVTGAIASFWLMMVLSAAGSSVALLPVLAAIIWGALVFVVCFLRPDPVSRWFSNFCLDNNASIATLEHHGAELEAVEKHGDAQVRRYAIRT